MTDMPIIDDLDVQASADWISIPERPENGVFLGCRREGFPMRPRVPVLAVGLLRPISALAQNDEIGFATGDLLYQNCTSSKEFDQAICLGYVMWAADALQSRKTTCGPKGVSGGQNIDAVTKKIPHPPEQRHHSPPSADTSRLHTAVP